MPPYNTSGHDRNRANVAGRGREGAESRGCRVGSAA